jgi:hypothetical protein
VEDVEAVVEAVTGVLEELETRDLLAEIVQLVAVVVVEVAVWAA